LIKYDFLKIKNEIYKKLEATRFEIIKCQKMNDLTECKVNIFCPTPPKERYQIQNNYKKEYKKCKKWEMPENEPYVYICSFSDNYKKGG